jgi:hypothetical protein
LYNSPVVGFAEWPNFTWVHRWNPNISGFVTMFIDQLWETVIGEHVELSAPRRTGKTHLLHRALSISGK